MVRLPSMLATLHDALPGPFWLCLLTCNALNYPSTWETSGDRAERRADKIRARQGWTPGILNGREAKPKGMLWRTYQRLVAEHDRYADIFMTAIWQRLRKMDARLEHLGDSRAFDRV